MDASSERWLPVVDWEGLYEVSDQGRVRSVPRPGVKGQIRKLNCDTRGYPIVSLHDGSRRKTTKPVHRLVLDAFVGPRPEGMECCHNDGNRTNNHLDNLRWDTKHANMLDAIRHGARPNPERTHCRQGHDLSITRFINSAGYQCCRECAYERVRRYQEKLKAQRRANPKPRKRRTPKTHCKHGHEFTPENTYVYERAGRVIRQCRTCAITYANERYKQMKSQVNILQTESRADLVTFPASFARSTG